jgi:hypothetical protein
MSRRLSGLSWAALLAGLLALSGCVTPATGDDSYRGKAYLSLEAATSEVETTSLTVAVVLRDRIFTTTADETVTASEKALGSISAAFESVQPPPQSDPLRDQVSQLLSDAEDSVAAARIAIRRSDRAALAEVASSLGRVSVQLDQAERSLG